MELSVVIPVRNGVSTLRAQLDALLVQEWDGSFEVVVADGGSSDGTFELAKECAEVDSRVRVERVGDRNGAGAVRNAGAALAQGVAVAFCDADDIVAPTWIEAMGGALRDHDAVTGPLDVAALNPDWLVKTRGSPSRVVPMSFHGSFPILPAGNFGMRLDVWKRLGGFDESVLANEDADLSLRAWQQHIAVHFAPRAIVQYRYRRSARDLFAQGMRYGTYRALVARRARDAGVPGVPRCAGWRSWLVLAGWLPRVFTTEGRASWCWVAGVRLGLVRGCMRYRVVYL